MSLGGNILLHMATQQPSRVEAMVVVSATTHFPEQARAIMAQTRIEDMSAEAWEVMRARHKHGDAQILALWEQQKAFKDSFDDMNFTRESLGTIAARTMIIYGDRDPLYPVEIGLTMFSAIPQAALWVIPNSGHSPIFGPTKEAFVEATLGFLKSSS
jgi:pimeloyl-ACP methyl ester carboxylesterase